jgi:hypothetical protein
MRRLVRLGSAGYPGAAIASSYDFVSIEFFSGAASLSSVAPRTLPGPRPSARGDQGIYLACLPARNIRPSHSPSTWVRPAPPRRRPGKAISLRASEARPIQPARRAGPARTTHCVACASKNRWHPRLRVCTSRGRVNRIDHTPRRSIQVQVLSCLTVASQEAPSLRLPSTSGVQRQRMRTFEVTVCLKCQWTGILLAYLP